MSIAIDSKRMQSLADDVRLQSIAIGRLSGDARFAGRRRGLRCCRGIRARTSASGVVDASPEVAPIAVAYAHNAATFRAGWRVFICWTALGSLFFDTRRRHAFGKSAFFYKCFAMLFEKSVDHVQGSTNENEHGISENNVGIFFRLLPISEPRREFLPLGYDMFSKIVVNVGTVIGGIKSYGVDGVSFGGVLWPWRKVFVEKPSEVVIAQFTEARFGNINKFKRSLHRSGEAFASFGKIFNARARGLSHLVKLATAGIVAKRKKTPTKYERFELDDVKENVSVKPLIASRVFKKFSHIENFSRVECRKARRVA